jgi:hypothetical protein
MTTLIAKLTGRDVRRSENRRRGFTPGLQNLEGRMLLTAMSVSPIGGGSPTAPIFSTSPSAR